MPPRALGSNGLWRKFIVGLLFVTLLSWFFIARFVEIPRRHPSYRIADGIKIYPDAAGCDLYPNSLVCAYQRRTKVPDSVPDLVATLIERGARERPPRNVAVLHLRLGDGLCAKHDPECRRWGQNRDEEPDCWNNEGDCWVHPQYPFMRYAFSKPYYVRVAKELEKSQRIVILANMGHWTRIKDARNGSRVDETYRDNVANFFKAEGFQVEIREAGSADDDFSYACYANTFVQGGGGFSALVAKVVQAMGNIVLPSKSVLALQERCGTLCAPNGGTFNPGRFLQQRTLPDMDCKAYFAPDVFRVESGKNQPPIVIPQDLLADFTLQGASSVTSQYSNNVSTNDQTWTASRVAEMVELAGEGRLKGAYGTGVTNAFRAALKTLPLRDARVLVIGSVEPWVEACLLLYGVKTVVTLTRTRIVEDHPKIEAMLPADFQARFLNGTLGLFSAVISFELEHAGLGRFGEELNPWGDILEVARAWCVTEDRGSLVIGVMQGKDEIVFNQGRRYGSKRLPYLATGWSQVYNDSTQEGRPIHIFTKASAAPAPPLLPPHVGSREPMPQLHSRANHANVVWTILGKEKGVFVEVSNGQNTSNTLALEERHEWTGLLVATTNCPQIDSLKRHAWRFCGCVGGSETGCFSLKTLQDANVSHIDYFSLDIGGTELSFLQSLLPHLNKELTVDVWTVSYRQRLEESLEKLNATRDFFSKLGYKEWGFLGRGSAHVPAENGTDVVFVSPKLLRRISVVVPAIVENLDTGELSLLLETIDKSVMQPYEVVIVITGTNDQNCAEANQELTDPLRVYPVRVFCFSQQERQAIARNRGIDRATGEWVSFIDADDPMDPHRLEVMSRYIREHPDLKLFLHAYGDYPVPKNVLDGKGLFDAEAETRGRQAHILIDVMNSQASARRDVSATVRFREGPDFYRIEDAWFIRDVIKHIGRVGPEMIFHPYSLSDYEQRAIKQSKLAALREARRLKKANMTKLF